MRDGKRRVVSIFELLGIEDETLLVQDLFSYQQLQTPEQTPYNAADLAMSVNHKLSDATGWIGSITYDLPQPNSPFELSLVSISYHLVTIGSFRFG